MSENNDNSNESNSVGSDSLLQSSRLIGGGTVSGNPVLRAGVLRPSVLGPSRLGSALSTNNSANNVISSSNDVQDSGMACGGADDVAVESTTKEVMSSVNPFLKEQTERDNKDLEDKEEQQNSEAEAKEKDDLEDIAEDRPDPLTLLRRNGMERSNLFAAAKSSIPLVEKSGFVFGQNVHERVVGENIKPDTTTENTESSSSGAACAGGGGELLFSSVIQNAAAKTAEAATGVVDSTVIKSDAEVKSLTDVAREYEESRAQKRKYEEVETFTGEENESNIVDLNCKLFAFVNSNWEERGRGSLRLNDSKNELECSRLVFRTAGNLRLLLNTKVWAGMVAERPSQKSLRLTAMDNTGKIKIYLVMARPVEINQLHGALTERIEKRKSTHPEEMYAAVVGNTDDDEEANKNGAAASHEVEKAAAVAEPDHDDSTEPSPKKSLMAVDEQQTTASSTVETSDN